MGSVVNDKWVAGYEEGKRAEREMLLARLKNPDKAMVEAVWGEISFSDSYEDYPDEEVASVICALRALADHLAKEPE